MNNKPKLIVFISILINYYFINIAQSQNIIEDQFNISSGPFDQGDSFNGHWEVAFGSVSTNSGNLDITRSNLVSNIVFEDNKKIKTRIKSKGHPEVFYLMFSTDGKLNLTNNMEGLGVSFTIAERDPSFQIIHLKNGRYTTFADKKLNMDELTDWMNVEINDYGNFISVSVNNHTLFTDLVGEFSTSNRSGNKVAIYSRKYPLKNQQLGSGCLVDYINVKNSPLSTFQLVEGNFTWDEAKADAEAKGGRLAVLNTQDKYDQMSSYLDSIGSWPSIWVGMTDLEQEGVWKWITGEIVSSDNWRNGEPNGGSSQNYGRVGASSEGWGKGWDDISNNFTQSYLLELTTETEPTLEDGLVAYYPFNGNANDESENNNNGTVNGVALSVDRNGRASSAYEFDGSSYIELPDGIYFDGPFTISGWVKISEHCNWCRLVDFSSENQQNHVSFSLSQNRSGQPRGDVSGNNNSILSDTSIPLNKWSQILWKYDGEFTEMFINGNRVAVEEWSNPPLAVNRTDNWIGRSNWENSPTKDERTRGLIDDIRIYDRALSSSEVSELYELEKPTLPDPSPPVVSFDEFYEALPDETITIDATPESGFPEDFTYQWYFGTFLIPEILGGKSNSFVISANDDNNGVWTVKVSNSVGSTESSFYFAAYKDTDGDGISDGREEYVIGSDPTLADTDGDGLKDYDEVYTYGTSFSKPDTDGDGFDDIFEINTKYDPLNKESTPEAYLEIQTAVEIKFNAGKNMTYKIENSVDLENWNAIETGVAGEGKLVQRLYSIDDYKGRYFRVRREED